MLARAQDTVFWPEIYADLEAVRPRYRGTMSSNFHGSTTKTLSQITAPSKPRLG